jgi:transposase, IS5 family
VQGNMQKGSKRRASAPNFVSASQLVLAGFETPFSQQLRRTNRWVVLAGKIPWDDICNIYTRQVGVSRTGRPPISPRIVIGSLIIKHMCNLDDRETVAQIAENMYMQYFLGYSSFNPEPPFDASLFVEFRTRMGLDQINAINERIHALYQGIETEKANTVSGPKEPDGNKVNEDSTRQDSRPIEPMGDYPGEARVHKGRVLFDATACPQDIAYPTDLGLLSEAREKSEQLIDEIYSQALHRKKPRTYREVARKEFLKVAQKKNKTRSAIRKAIGKQLRYLARNLKSIDKLLDGYKLFPLDPRQQKYLMVIHTLYQQQKEMFDAKEHTAPDRIVSIHQPHVRPIVRGKTNAKVEFGAKIHISLVDGYTFLDELSWDAFNEGSHMMAYVEQYRSRFGYYPKEVLADQIYCNRKNRKDLKEKGIRLVAKPLGRPPAVKKEHLSPGERNPIEGKFGQAKTAYGLANIKARLKDTSESWIACIFLVLNLVKLAGVAPLCLLLKTINWVFSALYQRLSASKLLLSGFLRALAGGGNWNFGAI